MNIIEIIMVTAVVLLLMGVGYTALDMVRKAEQLEPK